MITLAAQLEGISSRVDKSWKITFGTQELDPIEIGSLGQMQNETCYLAINPNPFTSDELEKIRNTKAELADNGKTHSQRLRGVLYVSWKNEPLGYDNFHDYYIVQMEKIINHFKSKLP